MRMKDKITAKRNSLMEGTCWWSFQSVFKDWTCVVNVAIALAPSVEGSIEICNKNWMTLRNTMKPKVLGNICDSRWEEFKHNCCIVASKCISLGISRNNGEMLMCCRTSYCLRTALCSLYMWKFLISPRGPTELLCSPKPWLSKHTSSKKIVYMQTLKKKSVICGISVTSVKLRGNTSTYVN